MELKGEVPWKHGEISVVCKNAKQFDVKVPGRTYHFTTENGSTAQAWTRHIEELLQQHS